MLQVKDTKIFSEISTFFTEGQSPVFLIISALQSLNLRIKSPSQSEYSRQYKLFHLLLIYLLKLPNVKQYLEVYESWLECSKDVFYRFKNNSSINWRKVLSQVNKKLFINDTKRLSSTKCFIADDTDFQKSGKQMEFIGKIFNHLKHSYNLGYKSLHLNYWNGTSNYGIDQSFHIELGKNENQGMSEYQLANRFIKNRAKDSPSQKRINELTENKISVLIKMLTKQVRLGFKADYLLADSWFTCVELIKACLNNGMN